MKRFLNANIFRAVLATVVLTTVAVMTIWGFTGEAHSTPTLGKGDRLDIQSRGATCSRQAWPYYDQACLRSTMSELPSNVRVVTAPRRI